MIVSFSVFALVGLARTRTVIHLKTQRQGDRRVKKLSLFKGELGPKESSLEVQFLND